MPSPDIKGQQRGFVIPIGGAEEKIDNPEILTKFVETKVLGVPYRGCL